MVGPYTEERCSGTHRLLKTQQAANVHCLYMYMIVYVPATSVQCMVN